MKESGSERERERESEIEREIYIERWEIKRLRERDGESEKQQSMHESDVQRYECTLERLKWRANTKGKRIQELDIRRFF